MTDTLQLSWQSTPAIWWAYYDPEGLVGEGKTEREAIEDLLEKTDEKWGEALTQIGNARHRADAAEMALSKGATWIPVSERLPALGGDQHCYAIAVQWGHDGSYLSPSTAWWDLQHKQWRVLPDETFPEHDETVTHWMPLPEAP